MMYSIKRYLADKRRLRVRMSGLADRRMGQGPHRRAAARRWGVKERGRIADVQGYACLLLVAIIGLVMLCWIGSAGAETRCYACHSEGLLNIRDAPGGAVIGYLYPGDAVTVLDTAQGWAHVQAAIEAGEGYVSLDYLTDTPGDPACYTVTGSGRVRVRTSPGGDPTGQYVHPGDSVTVTGWLDGWANIGEGWVDASYLEGTK